MSKSVRVVVTRETAEHEWPFLVFGQATSQSSDAFILLPCTNTTWLTGNFTTNTCIIDHVFDNAAELDANRDAIYAHIPWWKNDANAAEVDAYTAANNLVVTISEVTDPDISQGWDPTPYFTQ